MLQVAVPEEELPVSHDPGEWPSQITDQVRQILTKRGPSQVTDVEFPVNKDGRRFSVNNYRRRLRNSEEVPRVWLIYSVVKDVIFCFCCRLFSTVAMSLSTESGYSDWKHMSELLSEHETSPHHMRAYQSWRECNQRLRLGKTIDSENQRIIQSETERWREVFKRLVFVIEYLGSQNLAFRGKSDLLFQRNNGNFLKLLEFIGKFDVVIADHLRRITSKESYVHYLGKNIQNEIIVILGSKIKQVILNEVSKSFYYSIILDCTPDMSHTEQMTLIIRYVHCISGKEPSIQERFLGFVPIDSSTGEAITNILLTQLKEMKLPLCNMRGQGYDNGANMKGKHAGVQNRILQVNPRAFFVPCSTHSLNLVVTDAALSCNEAVTFFGIVQEIYNFFSASTHRWSLLKEHVPNLTLKPLCETRWESRIDAVTPFRYQIGEIYDALYELSIDTTRTDAFGKNTASSLAGKLKSFKFVCCLIVWHTILYRINLVSKVLQKENMNISNAVELLGNIKSFLESMRSENGFEQIMIDAKEIAETLDIETQFPAELQVRPRKIKRQFDYETHDESTLNADPKTAFKVN